MSLINWLKNIKVVIRGLFLGFVSMYTLARLMTEWNNLGWFEWSAMIVLSLGALIVTFEEITIKEKLPNNYYSKLYNKYKN